MSPLREASFLYKSAFEVKYGRFFLIFILLAVDSMNKKLDDNLIILTVHFFLANKNYENQCFWRF